MSEELLRQVSESIRVRGERPSRVQWDEMVERGAIDRDGKVLIRRPEPPPQAAIADRPDARTPAV